MQKQCVNKQTKEVDCKKSVNMKPKANTGRTIEGDCD